MGAQQAWIERLSLQRQHRGAIHGLAHHADGRVVPVLERVNREVLGRIARFPFVRTDEEHRELGFVGTRIEVHLEGPGTATCPGLQHLEGDALPRFAAAGALLGGHLPALDGLDEEDRLRRRDVLPERRGRAARVTASGDRGAGETGGDSDGSDCVSHETPPQDCFPP